MGFGEFVEHIYHNKDDRVANHADLKFFLLNISCRLQALKQGSFLVAQQLNDAHLSINELLENLNNDDDSVPRKIISMGKNLPNTDPYWRNEKTKLDALCTFRAKEFGDMPVYFDTNSCAEFHWKPLHTLLIKYHSAIHRKDEKDIHDKFYNDNSFKRNLILKNLHIVTNYFDARVINYNATVNKILYDYSDVWWRYEFAKSRGEIHSHAVVFSATHAAKIKVCIEL